ncbi:MAG: AAA family ATPase [Chloroflexia bacterium]
MPDAVNTPPAATALVGREREQGLLRDALAAALAGRGSLVLIGGEAGIGKTALAEATLAEAARGALVLGLTAPTTLTETLPYGPWADLFARYLPTHDLPPHPAAFAARGGVGDSASQGAVIQQVLDWCAALAAARPLVLLLDDLHWADEPSLALLRAVARALPAHPLLLVATYRADEVTRDHPLATLLPLLVREAAALRVDLRPLSLAAVHTYVAARYRLPAPEAARLADYLHGRAEGNALYLGELLRTLEEEGVLRATAAGWHLGDTAAVRVPALLRQVIDRRVARLGAEAQPAGAGGARRVAPFALWAELTGADDETLLTLLEEGEAARILKRRRRRGPPLLPRADPRRDLRGHPAAAVAPGTAGRARALAGQPRPDPDVVARHFQQAGDPAAIPWLVRRGPRPADPRLPRRRRALPRGIGARPRAASGGRDAFERGWLLLRLAHVTEMVEPLVSAEQALAANRIGVACDDRALAAAALFQAGAGQLHVSQGRYIQHHGAGGPAASSCAAPGRAGRGAGRNRDQRGARHRRADRRLRHARGTPTRCAWPRASCRTPTPRRTGAWGCCRALPRSASPRRRWRSTRKRWRWASARRPMLTCR